MKRTLLPLLALLGGCMVGPNYKAPPAPPATTTGFVNPTPGTASLPPNWWRLYADPTLDTLVDDALRHNTDLRTAAANVKHARAVLSEARAAYIPQPDLSAQYTHSRIGAERIGASGTTIGAGGAAVDVPDGFTTNFSSVGIDINYELDLFGRIGRSVEAARGDLAVAAASLDASRVVVAADTTRAYGEACAYAAQAAAARETIRLQSSTLDLTQRLYTGGRGTQRDVDQARTLFEQARADLPTIEGERRATLAALAVLTGRAPAALDPVVARCAAPPHLSAPLPAGDATALLARRADIRRAERQLAADTARIGIAVADLYPTISILGSGSLGASKVTELGTGRSLNFSFGPLISWRFPIQSEARARIRQAEATAEGSLAGFDAAVLTALNETEQALARLDAETRRNEALTRAYAAAADAAKLSRYRFDYGADSFLQLLEAERDRANTSAALASSNTTLVDRQVDLFRALGGGWEVAPPVASVPVR